MPKSEPGHRQPPGQLPRSQALSQLRREMRLCLALTTFIPTPIAAQSPRYDRPEWSWAEWQHEFASAFGRMWQRRRERQALLELDDRLLEDVGVTREQALRQARK